MSTAGVPQNAAAQWLALPAEQLTLDAVQLLGSVADDLWVAVAGVDALPHRPDVQRAVLALALSRTESAVERSRRAYDQPPPLSAHAEQSADDHEQPDDPDHRRLAHLTSYLMSAPRDAQLLQLRATLLERLDRLNSYVEILSTSLDSPGQSLEDPGDPWADEADPWEQDPSDPQQSSAADIAPTLSSLHSTLSLPHVMTCDLFHLACQMACEGNLPPLRTLLHRHAHRLYPFRFHILDCIPPYVYPTTIGDLFPSFDSTAQTEKRPESRPWRDALDWAESSVVFKAMESVGSLDMTEYTRLPASLFGLSAKELSAWYRYRIERIVDDHGLVNIALATVQHASSLDVPYLDELDEELHLLGRLVYDSSPTGIAEHDWTLSEWRSLTPQDAITAYLAHSTVDTVIYDIRRLVLPFIFVFEARAERSGNSNTSSSSQLLTNYVLGAPLPLVAAIFEASKPTLPLSQRLIKRDEHLACIALSCIYGSDADTEWPVMSEIFECLPAWPTPDADAVTETNPAVASLLRTLVSPSQRKPAPADLFTYFTALSTERLSHALDVLDVHLESGEILARWNVPLPPRWFLQSAQDKSAHEALANRTVRNYGSATSVAIGIEEWEKLLEDMLRLTGGEADIKGAFGLLSKMEIVAIFFKGLLSSGYFDVAKMLLSRSEGISSLGPTAIEDICISCSQEFYDNSSSGNYKHGDMKLAYDCLDVPPPSENIIREREFIEATSRICSFHVMTMPDVPISPIEIRLVSDRLSLVSKVLSSGDNVYKQKDMIMELVYKLGFRGNHLAIVKVQAMLIETALQAEDFDTALKISEEMVDMVLKLRASSPAGADDPSARQATEVCWVASYQLGRRPELTDLRAKLKILGLTLELCPPDRIAEILSTWKRAEAEDRPEKNARVRRADRQSVGSSKGRHKMDIPGVLKNGSIDSTFSLSERLRSMRAHIPTSPDAASLANQTLSRVTANLPFQFRSATPFSTTAGSQQSPNRNHSRSPEALDVSSQASKVLHKGIGWLIGADDMDDA